MQSGTLISRSFDTPRLWMGAVSLPRRGRKISNGLRSNKRILCPDGTSCTHIVLKESCRHFVRRKLVADTENAHRPEKGLNRAYQPVVPDSATSAFSAPIVLKPTMTDEDVMEQLRNGNP